MPELHRLRYHLKGITWRELFVLVGLALLITSCGGGSPAQPLSNPAQEKTSTPTPTSTQSPTLAPTEADFSSRLSQTQAEMDSSPGLQIASTTTPQPMQPEEEQYLLCSPLSIHPLEELREIVSDPYHPPPPGREERHQGVDFSYYRRGERTTIQGVGVQSIFPGRVAASIQDKFPYGNLVIVETPPELLSPELRDLLQTPSGESLYTLYAHMDKPPLVSLNETVEACQALGEVGKSGNAAEPHLHVEMRLGPASHDFLSMAYYGAKDTEEERSAYVLWRTSWQFRHFDPMSVLRVQP